MNSLVLIVVSFLGFANCGNIPDYIHICKRSDPQVSKCVKDSAEALKPRLKAGIPEIGVPGLEPLFINEIQILREGDSSRFRASLHNINVYGVSAFEINKLKVDVEKNIIRLGLRIPKLRLEGDYNLDVNVIFVPIKGNGTFTADIHECDGRGVLRSKIVNNNGRRQIVFTSFDLAIKIQDYSINLKDIFKGDPVLSQAANEVLNENKKEFIQQSLPFIQRKTSEIILEIANKITNNLDYDEVFPEK